MEEVRATLDDTGRLLGQELSSSGLNWTVPALYKRYGFLRRLKEEVFFDLLYYPYWVLRYREELSWRFFGKRQVEELRILDGVSARSQKLGLCASGQCAQDVWGQAVCGSLGVQG